MKCALCAREAMRCIVKQLRSEAPAGVGGTRTSRCAWHNTSLLHLREAHISLLNVKTEELGENYMRESKLRTQSMDFAISIVNLVKSLKEKRESIISN